MRPQRRTLCALTMLLALELAQGRLAGVAAAAPALSAESCSVEGLLADIRKGLGSRSEAYRRYLRNLLRESAPTLPAAALRLAFARETHPVVAEQLAAALIARSERGADSSGLRTVAERLLSEPDPALRAAVVRAMRRTSAAESTGDLYEKLVHDAAPEVRREAATNLVEDNRFVYFGHHGPATDAAVMAAASAASSDPQVTAQILGNISTEAAGPGAAEAMRKLLRSDQVEVRSAAAVALGGVPASESASARQSLIDLYRDESDPRVRRALLQGIAQLGFAGAIPDLVQLREVDPGLSREIDAWVQTLRKGLPSWELILREKQRLDELNAQPASQSGR